MLVLDSLGSDFEVEYKGETYKIEYVFPTALMTRKYMEIEEIEGQRLLMKNVPEQFRTLVTSIEGLKIKVGDGDTINIVTAKQLYEYPLMELQAIMSGMLDDDLKKKYTLTTKE